MGNGVSFHDVGASGYCGAAGGIVTEPELPADMTDFPPMETISTPSMAIPIDVIAVTMIVFVLLVVTLL